MDYVTKRLMKAPDSEKLRILAMWFDARDNHRKFQGERQVQADLRRMADRIELLEVMGEW